MEVGWRYTVHFRTLKEFMLRKSIIAASLALASLSAAAANYYVVVPFKKSTTQAETPQASSPPNAPAITVSLNQYALPAGTVGSAYSYDFKSLLTVTGDSAFDATQASFILASGALPAGLSLSQTGVVSGTPTTKNITGDNFQVMATYKTKTGQQAYTIVVNGVVMQVSGVSAGWNHACAVTTSGGVKCWGQNTYGQLGNNSTTDSVTPVAVSGLSGVSSVHLGARHSCAWLTDGQVKCWGSAVSGEIGDGTAVNKSTPVSPYNLGAVVSLAVGANHTCAAPSAGGVYCWGSNASRQVGDSSFAGAISYIPRLVTGTGVGVGFKVGAGLSHSCYTRVGYVSCWGGGAQGQLGNGTTAQQFAPTQVSNLTDAVEVYGGYGNTTCVLTSSNGVKCWGRNSEGELGTGSISTYSLTPVQVSGLTSGVASLSVGQYHVCARISSGGVKCWGANSYQQLTSAVGSYTATPTAIEGIAGTGVSAGYRSTCVNTTNGAQCWGDNTYGQLGDGTTNSAGGPVTVGQ